ncbi:MAG: hypothetical protein Q8O37_16515 [Sulfuricellaceae bacterium]|nr:hypothetical protein [Sulfuricellaceae bacterium]
MKRIAEEIWTYLTFALIVIGIVGLTWETFKNGGWLEQGLGIVLHRDAQEPLMATPIVVGILLLVTAFMRGGLVAPGKEHPFAGTIVYVLVASGLYFSYQWIIS